jgi:hypothetical protein
MPPAEAGALLCGSKVAQVHAMFPHPALHKTAENQCAVPSVVT